MKKFRKEDKIDDLVRMNYIEASCLFNKNSMKVGEVKKIKSSLSINQVIK